MAKKQQSTVKVQGFSRGVGLAVQMFGHLENDLDLVNQCSLQKKYRKAGTSHTNIILEYLDLARADGREVEIGFAAVLTDFVAACRAGCVPDTANYVPLSSGVDRA